MRAGWGLAWLLRDLSLSNWSFLLPVLVLDPLKFPGSLCNCELERKERERERGRKGRGERKKGEEKEGKGEKEREVKSKGKNRRKEKNTTGKIHLKERMRKQTKHTLGLAWMRFSFLQDTRTPPQGRVLRAVSQDTTAS